MHLVMKVRQLDWTIFKHSISTAQKPEGYYYGQVRKYQGFFFFFSPFFKNKSSAFPKSNPLLVTSKPQCATTKLASLFQREAPGDAQQGMAAPSPEDGAH